MRNRPSRGAPVDTVSGQNPGGVDDASVRGNIVEPFLASGGSAQFYTLHDDETELSAAPSGVQLVCAHYVAPGRVGFVKNLFCCPLVPPIVGEGSVPNAWTVYQFDDPSQPVRASERAGYYRTPLAWEAVYDPNSEGGDRVPVWSWMLVQLPGNVLQGRPRFDPSNPDTWYLALNEAVPASVYAGGFPGDTVWAPQRVQVTPEMAFPMHLVVAPNTTIALFARWTQAQLTNQRYEVTDLTADPPTVSTVQVAYDFYPLLPSVGRLSGYEQAAATVAAEENATFGWNG